MPDLSFDENGTPFSTHYGDIYHTADGALGQARHVFLKGNGLPERWQGKDHFTILETGFGLGLNFLSTWQAFDADKNACQRLDFVSVEKHPCTQEQLITAHQNFSELTPFAGELQKKWPARTPGIHRLFFDLSNGKRLSLTLIFGDARSSLKTLHAEVDAFYLDGFSPDKNPEIWSAELIFALHRLAANGATLATWSVAKSLCDNLQQAEFDVEKQTGFARKKQMLVGHFRSRRPPRHSPPRKRHAAIVGAGIAGCAAAYTLAAAGWQVDIFDAANDIATGASSNLAGAMHPLPSLDDNRLARLSRAGFFATRTLLAALPETRHALSGLIYLAHDSAQALRQKGCVDRGLWTSEELQFLEAAEIASRLGQKVKQGGWFFPKAGWVQPASLCRAALAAFPDRIRFHPACPVERFSHPGEGWLLHGSEKLLGEFPVLVIAAGAAARAFQALQFLPQYPARGQVSHLPLALCKTLPHVVLGKGAYVIPPVDSKVLTGATLQKYDDDTRIRIADHRENLAGLENLLPDFAGREQLDFSTLEGRAGARPMSPDRLPMVGAVPDIEAMAVLVAEGRNLRLQNIPRLPHLYCLQGFGARGIIWAALCADLLLSQIEGFPLPIGNDDAQALDPARFLMP